MKSYRQPLLTIFVIFATAYILTILGCAKASTNNAGAPQAAPAEVATPQTGDTTVAVLQPVDPRKMPECSSSEFTALQDWSTSLDTANNAVKASSKTAVNQVTAQLVLKAASKCEAVQSYHSQKPCKKTHREITRPEVEILDRAYDASRIQTRCEDVKAYITKFNLRTSDAPPVVPTAPPVVVQPAQPTAPASDLPQCSADEFNQIKTWRTSLDLANKNISRLGAALKYDKITIDAATTATQNCEKLIAYHQAQPCQREKVYTGEGLREQCKAARTYFYDFAQRKDSLITPNARLYFDTKVIANKSFRTGLGENSIYGNCTITNAANNVITYTGQAALVSEARVYTSADIEEGRNMFVFQTAEGLKFECYGLEYTSILTSKTEVVRLLQNKQTAVPLKYELN